MESKCPDEILRMCRMNWFRTFCACSKALFRLARPWRQLGSEHAMITLVDEGLYQANPFSPVFILFFIYFFIYLFFANSAAPDETAHNEPSHQELHCLPLCSDFSPRSLLGTMVQTRFKYGRVHFWKSGMKVFTDNEGSYQAKDYFLMTHK